MNFDHVSLGSGAIGFNSLNIIINNLIKKKSKKNFNIALIDRDIKNFFGGIAYSTNLSKGGYFNNPARLSPSKLINYLKTKSFFNSLNTYIENYGTSFDKIWLKKNIKFIKKKKIDEIYFPRVSLYFWNVYLFNKILNKIRKFNKKSRFKIKIFFFQADIVSILKKKNLKKLISKTEFKEFEILKTNTPIFSEKKSANNSKNLYSKYVTLGIGIPNPKKYLSNNFLDTKGYLWKFYEDGGSENLSKKLKKVLEKNKKIKLFILGYKAGYLEVLPKLMEIKKQKPFFKIFCVGSNLKSLEPANLTNTKNLFFSKFNYLMKKKNKLNAKEIYDYIYDILIINRPKKYSKYDVWTQILKRNILKKLISCLNKNNLKIYNEIYFQKIRSISRFTFPYLIQLKNEMEKKKLIKLYPYRLEKITKFKNKFLIQTDKKNFYCDFIINVTSPESVYLLAKKDSLIKSLKRFGDILKSGFVVDANFQLGNSKIFIPGVQASGFNPERETIIKAILKNSLISSNYISKSLTND